MYFPEKEGGRATIQNSNKNEGWTVGTQLLVDIDDPATLKKMNRVAANLGMTVAKVMIILKDQMENCTSTICIASKINNNHDIYPRSCN